MKKTTSVILSLILLAVSASTAYGQREHPIDKKFKKAIEKDNSTRGMKIAGKRALREWQQEMKKYYNLLISELGENEKVALKRSQKDWEKYRNSEVDFSEILYGTMRGSFFDIREIEGRVDIVKARALDLKAYYELTLDEKHYRLKK